MLLAHVRLVRHVPVLVGLIIRRLVRCLEESERAPRFACESSQPFRVRPSIWPLAVVVVVVVVVGRVIRE